MTAPNVVNMPRRGSRLILETPDGDIEVGIEYLDPERAAEFLESNYELQRSTKHYHVAALAHALRECWQFNADPIVISSSGKLLNGQHRCKAIVSSGISGLVLIVKGLPDDAYKAMDVSRPRTCVDVLTIASKSGELPKLRGAQISVLKTMCCILHMWRTRGTISYLGGDHKFNGRAAVEMAKDVPSLVEFAKRWGGQLKGWSYAGLIYSTVYIRLGTPRCDEFMEDLVTDDPLNLRADIDATRGTLKERRRDVVALTEAAIERWRNSED